MQQMPSQVLVISGLPASGKTTLAEGLTTQLHLPLVTRDGFKSVLFKHLPDLPPEGADPVSFGLMWYVAELNMQAGTDFILETHFYRPKSKDILNALAAKHGAQLEQIHCHAPLTELSRRHATRVASGQRPGIDRPFEYTELPPQACWEPLNLAGTPLLRLDTTEGNTLTTALKWFYDLNRDQT